jgi:hypothetical protein
MARRFAGPAPERIPEIVLRPVVVKEIDRAWYFDPNWAEGICEAAPSCGFLRDL